MRVVTTRQFYGGVGSISTQAIVALAKANSFRVATAIEALASVPDVSSVVVAEHISGVLLHPRVTHDGDRIPTSVPVALIREV